MGQLLAASYLPKVRGRASQLQVLEWLSSHKLLPDAFPNCGSCMGTHWLSDLTANGATEVLDWVKVRAAILITPGAHVAKAMRLVNTPTVLRKCLARHAASSAGVHLWAYSGNWATAACTSAPSSAAARRLPKASR